jgi:amicyanin
VLRRRERPRIPGSYLVVNRIAHSAEGAIDMQPPFADPELTPRTKARGWRLAALTAASTVALAACGASAAGTSPSPTPAAPSATSGPANGARATPSTTADVGIANFKFTPAAVTVKAGTTVVWTNKDSIAHSVNFTTGGINSNVLNQNEQFRFTFTTPGTYDYICSIHPFMHGSVTVTA